MKTHTDSRDPLDRIWSEVINIPADGSWLTGFVKSPDADSHAVKNATKAMRKLLAASALIEDLGRVGRAERYEAAFGVLYALEDPGLATGKLAGLHELLAKGKPSAKITTIPEKEFLKSLWDNINADAKGEFLAKQAGELATGKPFGDTPTALKRLLDAGIDAATLGCVAVWHRYESCFNTLKILAECFAEADETFGLHESILGADPSGLEGRPGSWPFKVEKQKPQSGQKPPADRAEPKFAIKSVQNFDFTPDSKSIVGCGSGPIRVYDIADGRELVSMDKAKNPVGFVVSPDSKYVVATLDSAIAVSEVKSGLEIARKRSKRSARVAWTPVGILVQSMDAERLLDPATLNGIPKPDIQSALEEGSSFHLSPDQKFVGNVSAQQLLIRTWPKLDRVAEWSIVGVQEAESWQWFPDGRFVLVGDYSKNIYDVKTGQLVWSVDGGGFGPFALSPDGKWLVTGTHSEGKVIIWNFRERSKVREFSIKAGWCFSLQISNDGKMLGAATHRQSLFWDFQKLVES